MNYSTLFENDTMCEIDWEYAEGIHELNIEQKQQLMVRSHDFNEYAETYFDTFGPSEKISICYC